MNNIVTKNLGVVSVVPKGEYDATAYYEKLNIVQYNGSTYMATQPSTGVLPTNTSYWQFIAGGVREEDIVDNLESTATNKPLSANQGNVLNNNINKRLKFHCVKGSFATNIVEFPNGKNMIIDTGLLGQWNDIKAAIDNLGITKFDYMIITHFHSDHIGNIQNLLNTYDFSNCLCWVQMKPDFENHSENLEETESQYDVVIDLLRSYNLNPTVPQNNSYYTIDENTKLHFLNTDSTIAENYYSTISEYREENVITFNVFSLICEIMYKNDVITILGDIERVTEQYMYPYMHKSSLLMLPHHGINRDYNKQFYYCTLPNYAVSTYISESDTYIRLDTKEFNFVKELGSKMVTSHNSLSVNGLFTFITDGQSIKTTSYSSGLNNSTPEKPRLYSNFTELVYPTEKLATAHTLEDIFNKMNVGDIFSTQWLPTYNTAYLGIYNELSTIFPEFTNMTSNLVVEFKKINDNFLEIKIYNERTSFIANSYVNQGTWTLRSGNGILNYTIEGITDLISKLKSLPFGHYTLKNYNDDVGDVLYTTGNYILSIDIVEKWVSNGENVIVASLYGVHRTDQASGDKARCFMGYINTSSTPQYLFRKID